MTSNSFDARGQLTVDNTAYEIYRINQLEGSDRLPYSLKVLLENLLRNEDGRLVTAQQISALGEWDPAAEVSTEIQYTPARVLRQDFTGVPCVVDLVAMRVKLGNTGKDDPLVSALPPQDHSVHP